MKKLMLIAVMAIVSTGVFAANVKEEKTINRNVKEKIEKKVEAKTKLKGPICVPDYGVGSSCGIWLNFGTVCFSNFNTLIQVTIMALNAVESLCPPTSLDC